MDDWRKDTPGEPTKRIDEAPTVHPFFWEAPPELDIPTKYMLYNLAIGAEELNKLAYIGWEVDRVVQYGSRWSGSSEGSYQQVPILVLVWKERV